MRPLHWLANKIRTFDYFWDYIEAAYTHFNDIFWGVAVTGAAFAIPFLIYGVVSQFRQIPPTLNWLAILTALLFAGYYVWRPYHIRLIKRIEIGAARTVRTRTVVQQTGQPGADKAVTQLTIQCATRERVTGCSGKLLSVARRTEGGDWTSTDLDEPLDLLWSVRDTELCTLEPDVPRKLNIFYVDDVPHKWIRIATNRIPFRMEEVFGSASVNDEFKFAILISGKKCQPVMKEYRVVIGAIFGDPTMEPIGA